MGSLTNRDSKRGAVFSCSRCAKRCSNEGEDDEEEKEGEGKEEGKGALSYISYSYGWLPSEGQLVDP